MIRTSYDRETDAMFLFLGLEEAKSARMKEVAPGVLLDFDAAGT